MRIRDISIDGFGVWSGLRLLSLDDGINVFYGPNEAGKTTLMQFLRAMLYGFSADRRQRYLPPVHGGAPGGELTLSGADGTFTVCRHALADGSTVGRLRLETAGETIRDERLLARLLGNVDEAVYRNVFAIGLREIQELGSLSDTEAAQWLYKLATGGDRVSLVDVLAELTKARNRLLATNDSPSTIPQLLAERDRLRRDSSAQASVQHFVELGRKRRELLAQIEAWENEAATAERAARLVEIAVAVHAKWHSRLAVEKDLAIARGTPRLEQRALAEFEALELSIEHSRRRGKSVSRRMAKNQEEVESLGLNEAIWRRATRIEAILEQEQWITALDSERVALSAKVKSLEARRAELCARLGFDPTETATTGGDGLSKSWRQLKPLAAALRSAHEQLEQLTAAAAEGQKGVQAAAQSLSAALKARGADSLTPLLERTGELVSQLRRRVQLDDRLTELARRKTELEARSRDLLANALLPGWALIVLGAVFVLGVVGILAGLFLPASLVGTGRWMLSIMGVAGSAGSAVTKFLLEKSLENRSATCLAQLETLAGQTEEATHERDELDETLPRGGGPLLARLQAAEKERAAVEALVPLEAKRLAADQESDTAEKRREEAHQAYTELRHRWRQALVAAGLSPKTPPARAGRLARLRKYLVKFDAQLTSDRDELSRRQIAVDGFTKRLAQLRAELDMRDTDTTPDSVSGAASKPAIKPATPPTAAEPAEGLIESLRTLREQLHEQTALAARRRSLIREGRRLLARRRKVRSHLHRLRRKLETLLEHQGAADVAELRRRAQESLRGDQLANQLDALAGEITAIVPQQLDISDVARLVTSHGRPELDQQWLDHSSRARAVREQVKSAHEQLGRWQQESQTLMADRQASQARLRLGTINQQLREAATRWRVLASAEWFLAGVRKRYERDRQPETLREASGYLDRLTEGRYKRVWTPLDQDVLRVDDAQGQSLPIEVLSRGTREQLFLSLRLALVRWYARRGIDLPLVLDDVLVNFDARRATAAAQLLRDFAARGHQLLVFTCHQHMYELFRSLDVPARELPANPRMVSFGGIVVTEQEAPRAPTIVPPPPPVPTRPQVVEIIEPAPQPTNGHRLERDTAVEGPPAPALLPVPVAREPVQKKRAHVKFDCLHGPRGPFATALWHERVTYELTGDVDSEEPIETDDDWTDIDG
jgi:uncharacterized protein YhaN